MLSKALLSLLLAAPALASPVAQFDDIDLDSLSDLPDLPPASVLWSHEVEELYSEVPTSIVDVLATAVPSTWFEDLLTNQAAASSVYQDAVSGVFPDWYSKLPSSVQAWVTGADSDAQSALATETGLVGSLYSSFTADASSAAATITSGSSSSSAKATGSSSDSSSGADSTSGSSSTASADASSSGSASASASASPSSTSNGAAPMATGNVAFSVAGAVGLLGLAVAL